jgi:hypothetical protein
LEDSNKYVYYSGSAWADLISPSTGNAIINGAFDIFQRGTSITAGISTYVSDRWATVANHSGGSVVYTKQTFTPGSSPVSGVPNYLRMTATSPTGASYNTLYQRIEDVNTFAGQTVTLSFYAKADATRSVTISPFQDFGSGGSSQVGITTSTVSLTTTMTRFTYTFAVPSITGKTVGTSSYLGFELQFPLNVTSTIEITGVQLEAGSTATPFKRNAPSVQLERQTAYAFRWGMDSASAIDAVYILGAAYSTTAMQVIFQFPTTMRAVPTSFDWTGLTVQDIITGSTYTPTGITLGAGSPYAARLLLTGMSGLTAGRQYTINGSLLTAKFGFNAEL